PMAPGGRPGWGEEGGDAEGQPVSRSPVSTTAAITISHDDFGRFRLFKYESSFLPSILRPWLTFCQYFVKLL
ncbi:MAG: hypothetical protein N3E40_05870, partial [Dehalococcoidia bacterium]|nr:hypothetical protein [Dehalococcoidia bacterium]